MQISNKNKTKETKETKEIFDYSAYNSGIRAYFNSVPSTECPIAKESLIESRTCWFLGYYAAKIDAAIGHILEKYGQDLMVSLKN